MPGTVQNALHRFSSFNCYNDPMKQEQFLSQFYKCSKWGWDRLTKIAQRVAESWIELKLSNSIVCVISTVSSFLFVLSDSNEVYSANAKMVHTQKPTITFHHSDRYKEENNHMKISIYTEKVFKKFSIHS